MPRGRKKIVEEKDFEKLINDAQKKIDDAKHKIETEKAFISEQKKMIKQLQKEKVAYEEYKVKIDEESKMNELLKAIKSSGKSLDEIEAFIKGETVEDVETKTK